MDWGIVYQLTFFLTLGLLAIVVTIFVFAVSQVGRATESASREQQDLLLGQKEAKEQQIEEMQKQLEEARKAGHLDESKLLAELQNTREKITGYDTQLKRLQERITLIRRRGAVVCPGAFFLTALVLTILASGLAESQNLVALPLWIISIGALVFGGYRVFRTLGAIEEVTITSQEVKEKLPDTVKAALRELEEEKRPQLELRFEQQLPFHIKAGSQTKLEFSVGLISGEVADNVMIGFHLPPGFSFPGKPLVLQNNKHPVCPNFVTARVDYRTPITSGGYFLQDLVIKAPSKAGQFQAYYRVFCRGFTGGLEEFEIVVGEG